MMVKPSFHRSFLLALAHVKLVTSSTSAAAAAAAAGVAADLFADVCRLQVRFAHSSEGHPAYTYCWSSAKRQRMLCE
jgi:hypothetical protein